MPTKETADLAEFNKMWETARPKKEYPRGEELEIVPNVVYKVEVRATHQKEGKFSPYYCYFLSEKSPTHPNGVFFLSGVPMNTMNEFFESNWTDTSKPIKVMFVLGDKIASKANPKQSYNPLRVLKGTW